MNGDEDEGPPCIGCDKPLTPDSECPAACNEECLEKAFTEESFLAYKAWGGGH